MKTLLTAAAGLTLSLAALQPAMAQQGPGRLDANGDGKVTKAEFQAGRVNQMMRMDANKDGKVSREEFASMAARRAERAAEKGAQPKGKGDGSRLFDRVDANRDGFLDRAELGKMAEQGFARMDENGDGALSGAELTPRRGPGMAGGGGR